MLQDANILNCNLWEQFTSSDLLQTAIYFKILYFNLLQTAIYGSNLNFKMQILNMGAIYENFTYATFFPFIVEPLFQIARKPIRKTLRIHSTYYTSMPITHIKSVGPHDIILWIA